MTATLPQLTNDRSAATLGAAFCAYPTYAGGTQLACDGSNINPVALKLLNFKLPDGQYAIPNPQINLANSDPTQVPIGESTYATPATYREDQFTANIDHAVSPKDVYKRQLFHGTNSMTCENNVLPAFMRHSGSFKPESIANPHDKLQIVDTL